MLKLKFSRFLKSPKDQTFCIGKRIHSTVNGRVCFIKSERVLNRIKHFSLLVQNEPVERQILLSEQVVRQEYRVID